MPSTVDPDSISRARKLRHDITDGERRLWAELKIFRTWYGIHVRRQAPIGSYVADFVIHEKRLVIEIDGEHHQLADRQVRDRVRDERLAVDGYRVVRINTGELGDNFDGCVETILREVGVGLRVGVCLRRLRRTPTPYPSPQGGGGRRRCASPFSQAPSGRTR
jgi:very-short-patch-repair endonuclease